MSEFPWDILGIEPTGDELTIRRAYARKLKEFRPDEDPEGFAKLVRAREQALQRRLVDNTDALVAEGGADESPANQAEEIASPKQSRTDASQGSLLREFGATVALTDRFDAHAQAVAFAAAMNGLRELTYGVAANDAGPIWDAGKWRSALTGMSEFAFWQRRLLREFVVREALPRLPAPPSIGAATSDMLEDRGPGPVVAVWEGEFSTAPDQSALARLCGTPAMLRYLAWLALVEQLLPLHKRSEAERHVIDRLAALLPLLREDAGDIPPNEAWVLRRWEELFGLIRQLRSDELPRCRALLIARLMVWLPAVPVDTLSELNAGRGPAAVVEAVEREFSISGKRGESFVDLGEAARYNDWLDHVRRLRELERRLVQGAAAYRDHNGLPKVPKEDLALGALPDESLIEFVEAQRSGGWWLKFQPSASIFTAGYIARRGAPLLATALLGIEIAALPLALMLAAVAQGLHLGAMLVVVLLTGRAFLACSLTRLSVLAAVQRVRRADRAGVVDRERRGRIVTIGRFGWLWGTIVGLTEWPLPFMLVAVVLASFQTSSYNPVTAGEWIQWGESHLASKPDQAIEEFTRAIAIDPNNALAYYRRGCAYASVHRSDKAIEDFDRAIALNPGDAAALFQRALTHSAMGNFDAAITDYSKVISENAKFRPAFAGRGYSYFYQGRFGDAATDLAQAFAVKPDAYSLLFLHISQLRGPYPADSELASRAEILPDRNWPYPVIEMFLGRRTGNELLALAGNADQVCEANFYICENDLLHENRAEAVQRFKIAEATCPHTFVEYRAAVAELNRLNQ